VTAPRKPLGPEDRRRAAQALREALGTWPQEGEDTHSTAIRRRLEGAISVLDLLSNGAEMPIDDLPGSTG
jgi:hypothetical protein